uniref:Cysteine dioxygenase n=1 Tax=Ornithorhynchus anatinus TaxID=9258 RepID=A0A6I8NYQ5_ORNAN
MEMVSTEKTAFKNPLKFIPPFGKTFDGVVRTPYRSHRPRTASFVWETPFSRLISVLFNCLGLFQTSTLYSFRYTRNLVDQGNGKFNLMILCWGEGHGSSIHDHTNSHCFLKMLQGSLKETLFEWPDKKSNEMMKRSERVLRENQCAYINDSIGLHRVENTSHTEAAVSLHLYSPPFDTCHAFDQRTGHKNKVTMTFHSKFGKRTPFGASSSLENN